MDKIRIIFLGGQDESFKNMVAVEINNDIFVLEAGFKLPDKTKPGIDFIVPRYDYLIENKDLLGSEIVGVVGIGVTVLVHIAVTVVEHQALATAWVTGNLVVINQAGTPLVAFAVVEVIAQTAVHIGPGHITRTGK